MLTKMTPIDYDISKIKIGPGDIAIVKFKTKEHFGNKIKKYDMRSGTAKGSLKYKAVKFNVDIHIWYTAESMSGIGGANRQRREKITSAGLQSAYSKEDGGEKDHRFVFAIPDFDINRFSRSCLYISTDSVSSELIVSDIVIDIRKEKDIQSEKKLVFISTWGIRCGIATYSKFLVDAIKDIGDNIEDNKIDIDIVPINEGQNADLVFAKICHIQHEFGIMPLPPRVSKNSKCIVTFHTIMIDETEDGLGVDSLIDMGMGKEVGVAIGGKEIGMGEIGGVDGCVVSSGVSSGREMGMKFTVGRFENSLNIVAYIVHSEDSAKVLKRWTDKDTWTIPHGSFMIPDIKKEDARKMLELDKLGINIKNDKIGFVFGFQSASKDYNQLVEVANKFGIKLIISGAKHGSGKGSDWINRYGLVNNSNNSNVIFLEKYLSELEINLYALSSDLLLFNYAEQDHYSVSGAMHRILDAGRVCIIPDTKHFLDVKEWEDGVLKYKNKNELEEKIRIGLDKRNAMELGKNARDYAERTSWENAAKKHLEIYRHYVNFNDIDKQVEIINEVINNEFKTTEIDKNYKN